MTFEPASAKATAGRLPTPNFEHKSAAIVHLIKIHRSGKTGSLSNFSAKLPSAISRKASTK